MDLSLLFFLFPLLCCVEAPAASSGRQGSIRKSVVGRPYLPSVLAFGQRAPSLSTFGSTLKSDYTTGRESTIRSSPPVESVAQSGRSEVAKWSAAAESSPAVFVSPGSSYQTDDQNLGPTDLPYVDRPYIDRPYIKSYQYPYSELAYTRRPYYHIDSLHTQHIKRPFVQPSFDHIGPSYTDYSRYSERSRRRTSHQPTYTRSGPLISTDATLPVLETPINSRFYSATYVNTGSMQPVSHFDLTPASEEKRFFVMAVHPTQDRAYPEVKYFRANYIGTENLLRLRELPRLFNSDHPTFYVIEIPPTTPETTKSITSRDRAHSFDSLPSLGRESSQSRSQLRSQRRRNFRR